MLMITLLGIMIVIGVAMGDTAIDGLILDLYPKQRLGRVQGICWGFRSVGIIAGGRIADLQSRKGSIYYSIIIATGSFLLFLIPVPWYILLIFSFFILGSSDWKNSALSAVIGQELQLYHEMDSTYYATCNSFVNLGSTIGLQFTSVLFLGFAGLPVFATYALIFLIMGILINIDLLPFITMDPKEYEIIKN